MIDPQPQRPEAGPVSPPRRRNRNWLWVFAALGVLGVLAIVINWAYNVGQPLTPEKLAAARELWKKNRPASYDLKIVRSTSYSSSDGAGGTTVDRIELQVRDGRVTQFLLNGREPEPLFAPDGQRNLDEERRQRASYDIDGLFDAMEQFLEMDRREEHKSFMRARFDERDGHVMLFTRQIHGKRVPHIQVEMKRLP